MSERDEFFDTIRSALGRRTDSVEPEGTGSSALGADSNDVKARVQSIQMHIEAQSGPLMDALSESAAKAGWKVARFNSLHEAREYVAGVARDAEASLVVRSRQEVLEGGVVENWLEPLGVQVVPMVLGDGSEYSRDELRSIAERADIGITGVDYAIAETGTCVLIPSAGVSRLVSLLPRSTLPS